MANTNSIKKILGFLKSQKEPVTLTKIVSSTHLHFRSVKTCIELLDSLGKVDLMTNGRTTLVKLRE